MKMTMNLTTPIPPAIEHAKLFRTNLEAMNRVSRDAVLQEMRFKAGLSANLSRKAAGERNLIYFTVNYSMEYVDLLMYSLSLMAQFENRSYYDILVICPERFENEINRRVKEEGIKLPCVNLFFMRVPEAVDGVEASMNKLKIYKWSNLADYGKVLFLDTDIGFIKPPCDIFDLAPTPGILHSTTYGKSLHMHQQSYFTLTLYSEQDIKEFERRGIYAFNAGQFYFLNSEFMAHHFSVVDWLTKNWPGNYFFEQSFMNFYFNSMGMSDVHLLFDKIQLMSLPSTSVVACVKFGVKKENLVALHFAGYPLHGKYKLDAIKEWMRDRRDVFTGNSDKQIPRAMSLLKKNSMSPYSDDEEGRFRVFKDLAMRMRVNESLSKQTDKKRRLVYYTAFGTDEWMNVLYESLASLLRFNSPDTDVLIITDEKGREIIGRYRDLKALNIDYMLLPTPEDGVEASMNKLKIYRYSRINEYGAVLFLDSDVVVNGPLDAIFNSCTAQDKLHTAVSAKPLKHDGMRTFLKPFHSLLNGVTEHDLPRLEYYNQKPFNAGQYVFYATECMLKHFENVHWLAQVWPSQYFFEQAFMNHYFCNALLTDSTAFDKHVCLLHINLIREGPEGVCREINELNKDAELIHFAGNSLAGSNKLEFIFRWKERKSHAGK